MKTSDIRLMSDAELESEVEKTRRELLQMRCRLSLGEEVKSSEVKTLRRDIARLLTVQQQRKAQQPQEAGSEQTT